MLSVKQGGTKYHFLILWYDSTLDWTQVFRVIGEHSIFYILMIWGPDLIPESNPFKDPLKL